MTGEPCRGQEKAGGFKALPAPFTADEFEKHVVYLASDEMAGRAPGSEGSAKAATYLIEQFEAYGLKPLQEDGSWFQEFPLTAPDRNSGGVTGTNIVAVLPGQGDLSGEAIIVCAHYDHLGAKEADGRGDDTIFNGADDNAAGVAALLLVANALAGDKALPAPRRTLLFVSFDGEEQGLLGAKYYARRPLWPLEKTAAVVNFDAMGRMRMGKFFASDVETNPVLAEAVREAARERQVIVETRYGGHGRSDHAVFLDRGIPGTHFFTGANSDYHQVTDESNRLNFSGGADIAWIGSQVLRKAIKHPERLEFHKLDPSYDMTFLLNLVQAFGIMPNVNAQEGRYPQILFVMPNSSAAKHGIRSGDEITAINGLPFERVEDGLTIFQQLTLDDGVKVSLLRGGRKLETMIPGSEFAALSGPKAKQLENGKYEVEFVYRPGGAVKQVYLAGDFNDWQPTAQRMDGPDAKGEFTTTLPLDGGTYEYKFVVNGTDWTPDPKNVYRVGQHDNSVLWVGPREK